MADDVVKADTTERAETLREHAGIESRQTLKGGSERTWI
jgi:hypothetical protein